MTKIASFGRVKFLCETSALALLAGALVMSPAAARQIGVTAAVRPDVLGTPPDQESRILSIGTDVLANERIETSKIGQTHLLFIDGSALSVGPGASLVLDRFVYDPDTKTGELVVTASKGLMRFVGGALSKKKPILIKTPTATIGVRGGVAMINAGDGGSTPPSVTMLYGQEVFMESNGQRQTMTRPGFRISLSDTGTPTPPQQVSQEQLNEQLQALEEPPQPAEGENLGDIAPAGGGVPVTDEDVSGSQIGDLGSNNDPNNIGGGPTPPRSTAGTGQPNAATDAQQQQAIDSTQMTPPGDVPPGNVPPGDVPPADGTPGDGTPGFSNPNELGFGLVPHKASNGTPVGLVAQLEGVTTGATFSLVDDSDGRFAIDPVTGVISVANGAGIDFKADRAFEVRVGITAPDGTFHEIDAPSIEVAYTDYVGRAKRGTSSFTGTNDNIAAQNVALTSTVTAFQSFIANGFSLYFPDDPGTDPATNTNVFGLAPLTPFAGTTIAEGSTVLLTTDQAFFVHKLNLSDESRVFAFGGDPATVFPSSGVSAYRLDADFVRQSDLPLLDNIATSDHGEAFIAWQGGGSGQFGGGLVIVQGQGASQKSAMSAMSGQINAGAGSPHLIAAFIGSLRDQASGPNRSFFGHLATSDGGPGGTSPDFFGAPGPDYFVLESARVDTADSLISAGATHRADDVTSTYFPNSAAFVNPNSTAGQTRTSREIFGFASGLKVDTDGNGGINNIGHVRNTSVNAVSLETDASLSTVFARFLLDDNSEGSYIYEFGSGGQDGTSAFIDDSRFYSSGQQIRVDTGEFTQAVEGQLGLTTSAAFQHSGFLPSGVSLCACEHVTWGFFSADHDNGSDRRSLVHLGTWVAGEVSQTNQLVGIAPQSATYTGHIIGGVHNNGDFYHAAGNMSLGFTFGGGNFTLDSVAITNFDGTNFSSNITSGPGSFASNGYNSSTAALSITGSHPTAGGLSATVNGAFFGPGTPPGETAGTAAISGDGYKAETTFAAKKPGP